MSFLGDGKMSLPSEVQKSKAHVYYGDELCRQKSVLLLKAMGLPNWLMPFQDIQEFGYVEETGFVWFKRKESGEQKIEVIGKSKKLVCYDSEITAYVEHKRIKKLTGVRTKELFIWITLTEVHLDNPSNGAITFRAAGGLFKSFTISRFY